MSEQDVPAPERRSLRIAELTIENFRTFGERTVIPFSSGPGAADAIATFHGDNGSGKSNAIAALSVLIEVTKLLLQEGEQRITLPWDRFLSRRDRALDTQAPTVISARFQDAPDQLLRVSARPSGNRVAFELSVNGTTAPRGYQQWLATPYGPLSRPMAVLRASRRASWFVDQTPGEAIQPALAEALLEIRLSRDPDQRARWRDFEAALVSVPAFADMDISIDRRLKGGDPELTFERRGKLVLSLHELSSGERQLVVLFAGVLLANAAIVAIEEPELSLDAKSQRLFYDFLARLVEKRRIDQAIIESHVAAFDGPDVIRFHRAPGGSTTVTREPTAGPEAREIAQRAEAQGAKPRWVTGDGFTRLPEAMRDELHVGAGKHVWFLRGPDRWEAWPEEELDQMLGGAPETRGE